MNHPNVTLGQNAVAGIRQLCTEAGGLETGGLLIGLGSTVMQVTGPGPGAVLTDRFFEWDATYIQGVIHGCVYGAGYYQPIGRWHKHPLPNMNASPQDKESAEYLRVALLLPQMVDVIVACNGAHPLGWTAYLVDSKGYHRINAAPLA